MLTVTNPWHRPTYHDSKPNLSYAGRCLLSYRGVEVYKNPAGSWDYIYKGMAIAQRAGFHKDRAIALIDEMLAGKCILMCDHVLDHVLSA